MSISAQLALLKSFDLPASDFVIVSSGALAIRGIREAKDLDVIVTPALWNELIKTHPVGLNTWNIERVFLDKDGDIEILNPAQSIFGNSKIVPFQKIFDKADIFEGVRFMNLEHLKKIKARLGREIDLRDIELIDRYLTKQNH